MSFRNAILKTLRRKAEAATVGRPARELVRGGTGKYRNYGSTMVNDPKSTRGVYRALKKAARADGVI